MNKKLEIQKNDLELNLGDKFSGFTSPNENSHQVFSEILKADIWKRKIYPFSYGEASNNLARAICAFMPFATFYLALQTITPDELTVGLDDSSKTAVILFILINLIIIGSFVLMYFSRRNKLIQSILKCDYSYEIKPAEDVSEDLVDCIIKTNTKPGNYTCTVNFDWHYVKFNFKIEELNE